MSKPERWEMSINFWGTGMPEGWLDGDYGRLEVVNAEVSGEKGNEEINVEIEMVTSDE